MSHKKKGNPFALDIFLNLIFSKSVVDGRVTIGSLSLVDFVNISIFME